MKRQNTSLAILLGCFLFSSVQSMSQFLTITKMRPSEINTSAYKQIAIGDMVGQSGEKTEASLNLSDAIAAALFKANAQEVLDRNALEKILFTQSKLTTINENTVSQLKKKINGALLITGRIQISQVNQQQVSEKQGIVVNGCDYMYYWKAVCTVTAQIKIIDITTGKMVYTGPVTQESEYKTKAQCTPSPVKLDPVFLIQETTDSAASKVAHLVVPYNEEVKMGFGTGTMFKHPFKKINEAIANLEMHNNAAALTILKAYTEDGSLKDNLKAQAHYNYGLGLFVNKQYEEAKNEFGLAYSIQAEQYSQDWYNKMDFEKKMDERLLAQNMK